MFRGMLTAHQEILLIYEEILKSFEVYTSLAHFTLKLFVSSQIYFDEFSLFEINVLQYDLRLSNKCSKYL